MKPVQILGIDHHPLYYVRDEMHDGTPYGVPDFLVQAAYTNDGDHIGDPQMAKFLCDEKGILPEKSDPENNTCTIGRSLYDGKWYGWSHRAIAGFDIGDRIYEPSFGDDQTPFLEHGPYPIAILAEARRSAVVFAEDVS